MAFRLNLYRIRPSYILRPRGKNLKAVYFARCWLRNFVPRGVLMQRKAALLADWEKREDAGQIRDRVDYYNKLVGPVELPPDAGHVRDIPNGHGVYNRDSYEILRYFDGALALATQFGDNQTIPEVPAICKSRPISEDNRNAVLLNMDKVRHFTFLRDKRQFADKKDMAIFRGAVFQPRRIRFMREYFGHPLVDCADTQPPDKTLHPEWHKNLITLYDHLKYKFVVCLEGNDVASNLKWVMSSNSCAIMPRPTFETWFMEGRLVPGVHYIEIREDYADLEEKIRYYSAHHEEAEAIARNANEWCAQFQNPERELLIALLVMQKYFDKTKQKP